LRKENRRRRMSGREWEEEEEVGVGERWMAAILSPENRPDAERKRERLSWKGSEKESNFPLG
jgi:hypothetical protein